MARLAAEVDRRRVAAGAMPSISAASGETGV